MRGNTGPAAKVLGPIMDTYRNSALAVVGCHSKKIERPTCELDVIVVTNDRRPGTTVKLGDVFVDLVFVTEKDALKPVNPEHAVSLAHAKTVRDTSLTLSTSLASNLALLQNSARRASNQRLTSSLKSIGRAEEALSKGLIIDSDYWLLSAAYNYCYSLILRTGTSPSPSHILFQLRAQSKDSQRGFEAFSRGGGLEKASRSSCRSRLEGVEILYDLLGGGYGAGRDIRQTWSATRLDSVSMKAKALIEGFELAECYSYLGTEILNAIGELTAKEGQTRRGGTGIGSLAAGKDKLLGDRMLHALGFVRDTALLIESLQLLKDQVSELASKG